MSAQHDKPPIIGSPGIIGVHDDKKIIGGKGNVANEAAREFVNLKEALAMKDLVIQSYVVVIIELIKRLGGEVRIKKADDLGSDYVLITTDDPLTNEIVMRVRKEFDNTGEPTNSPKI